MRLHRLVISGVGPFAQQVEIDFARLGSNGLFLLEGPTGSGKSTVIDAISFALYGKVAQAGGDPERLRSHFAATDTESFVELTWETQAGAYRIRRTPRYTRAKKRGEGLRTVNPTVKLWRLGQLETPASAELLGTRIEEVADEITRAVGLSHAQFVQTVVLPQGEFANFLRAGSDDKRALLQKLFGTEMLAAVQANLIEERQLAEQRRSACVQDLTKSVHAFAGAANIGHITGGSAGSTCEINGSSAESSCEISAESMGARLESALSTADTALLTELTEQVVSGLADLRHGAAEAVQAVEQVRTQSALQLHTARYVVERCASREALRQRLIVLEAGRNDEKALSEEISAAERAAPVAGLAHAHDQALQRHQRAAAAADARRSRLPIQWRDRDELTLKSVADQLRWSRGALDEHESREAELLILRARRRQLSAEHAGAAAQLADVESAQAQLTDELADLIAPREQAAAAWATVESLRREHLQASQVLTAATAARSMRNELAHSEAAVLEALGAEQVAIDELHQLHQRRIDSIAGELGLTLRPGQACRVCGSLAHPAPAVPGSDHVTEEQLRLGEVRLHELAEARRKAAAELGRVGARFTELEVIAGRRTVHTAETDLQALHRDLEAALRAGAEMTAFDQRRATLLTKQTELHQRQRAEAGRVEVLIEQLNRCNADVAESERLLLDARGGFATVGERLIDIEGQLIVLDDAASGVAAANSALKSLFHVRADLDKALAEAGLDSEDAFRLASRDSEVLASMRGQLNSIHAERETVQLALATPELTDLALDAKPAAELAAEVSAGAAAVAAAELAYAEAAARFGAARDRLSDAHAHAERVRRAIRDGAAVIAATAAAIRLGYLAAGLGDNQLRMDLSTYVLVRRFEEIIAAANIQLYRVSSGRYELLHSEARQGNARSGLGLRVMDLRTDQSREPATLSGGETFYVSLSLALGLADVVRAESGGVDLGTLFIDEGFGSLDSEVLDEVLSVLDGLRAGGRAVGVVSHVAELKARIVDRIEIRPNRDGSSRLSVVA